MICVKELLEKRLHLSFGGSREDEWLEQIIHCNDDEVAIITTDNLGGNNRKNCVKRNMLLEKYNVSAMFELSDPLIGTNVNMFLYIFTKHYVDEVKIGSYKKRIDKKEKHQRGVIDIIRVIDDFPEAYDSYISAIETWVNSGTLPEETNNYSFNTCDKNLIERDFLSPRCYSKKVLQIKELLKKEQVTLLTDVAKVIKPKTISGEIAKTITASSLQYPFQYEELKEGNKTDTPLMQGDIILKGGTINSLYIVEETPHFDIHPSINDIVIRARGLSPEYLFVYLKSETAQIIMNSKTQGTVIPRLTTRTLSFMPVIQPKKNADEYKNICYFINHPCENTSLASVEKGRLYYEKFSSKALKEENAPSSLEDVLNIELIQAIGNAHSQKVKSLIEDDVKELNSCFRVKAYKATLILAGSILEAVLIEWLSEIDGKDYFVEDYIVVDRYTGRTKRADLIDYINVIKGLKKPDWMNEANMAHQIRQKRNLVHAKLGINSADINEETCRQVIQYLTDVLKTRM